MKIKEGSNSEIYMALCLGVGGYRLEGVLISFFPRQFVLLIALTLASSVKEQGHLSCNKRQPSAAQ